MKQQAAKAERLAAEQTEQFEVERAMLDQQRRALAKQQAFLKDKTGQPAMVRWWNGASALLDFTRPAAVAWFQGRLDALHNDFGVDGFKFDAGDATFYPGLLAAKILALADPALADRVADCAAKQTASIAETVEDA